MIVEVERVEQMSQVPRRSASNVTRPRSTTHPAGSDADPRRRTDGATTFRGRAATVARPVVIGLAVAGAVLLTGCDSAVGIPGDDPATTTPVTTPPAAIPAQTPPAPPTPPVPADAPPVGAVPGLPAAAPAMQRWAVDLETRTIAQLQATCWTLPPLTVAEMYADPQPVLAALAQPGTATDDVVTWRGAGTTVTVERAALDSGYACPRVYPAGVEPGYDDADARHTVRRYLARLTGDPLDAADQEGTHPLLCPATPATWDPQGTGSPVRAPLADNPGQLTGTTAFADQQINSSPLRAGYVRVQVPVTNSSGVTQNRTFTLGEAADGYCIGDVSP
ncbi:hypothetical protein [Nocardia cyriacigeorgica]|uniref:hypothetical protein n=1 Tax=Nocardia cyriacigeorgica TaxID=135487 RepID=UPI002458C729|nr:hypothetical protein [Nocardia cyriacigeorgica]